MMTERTHLVAGREQGSSSVYGSSYREANVLEEIHWQNKRKKQRLTVVASVVLVFVLLLIIVTLAITLPPLLHTGGSPPDPEVLPPPSPSLLGQFPSGGVSSESEVCSELGRDIMEGKGGNAVDAGVATAFCHGVTNPQSSGIGGGLFMTIYTKDGDAVSINGREVAGLNVDRSRYEENGSLLLKGPLSMGVPGEVAGLWEAHQRYGKLPWVEVVRPARNLAQLGFSVSSQLAKSLKEHQEKIWNNPGLALVFIDSSTGLPFKEGDLIKRPRLAATLQILEVEGASGFYNGTLVADMVAELGNGYLNATDFSSYRAIVESAIKYPMEGNLTLFSTPFPSSGVVVAMALGILQGYGKAPYSEMNDLQKGEDEHRLAEALKFAHAHRSFVTDPGFTDNATALTQKLLSKEYAEKLRRMIDPLKTYDSPAHYMASFAPKGGEKGTAHISVLGPDGDAVAITTSINHGFGCGILGQKTGIIYNNVMADFSPGSDPTSFGLLPNKDNQIEPDKRPASSMSPLIITNAHGVPILASGGDGGQAILSSVISTTWRALYRSMDLKAAIDYPRVTPVFGSRTTKLYYEFGLPSSIVAELRKRGHNTTRVAFPYTTSNLPSDTTDLGMGIGNVNSVGRTKGSGTIVTNADFRKRGGSAGF